MPRRTVLKMVAFAAYLAVLIYLMFFSDTLGRRQAHYTYNLQPFREITRFIRYHDRLGSAAFLNLAGNILCFMPCGFLPAWIWRRMDSWGPAVFMPFCLSLLIELSQFVLNVGIFDVDDLILNTLGGFLGYLCYCLYRRHDLRLYP